MINGKTLLSIANSQSWRKETDDLVQMTKMIFVEYRFPKKIVSDADTNLTAKAFKDFCRNMNNRPVRGLSPQMNRDPVYVDHDDVYCEALEAHQRKIDKGSNTQKDPPAFITGATEAVQWEDGRPWIHGVIVQSNNDDHIGHSYTIWVT